MALTLESMYTDYHHLFYYRTNKPTNNKKNVYKMKPNKTLTETAQSFHQQNSVVTLYELFCE